MCTVVCHWEPGTGVRILALRDEFTDRAFDEPDTWWPDQPDVVGGRDRAAGGTWCASDVASGRTALLVNRRERFVGTPSRGLLPLAALAHGAAWTDTVDHTTMASFNLVLAGPDGVTVWTWDAVALTRLDLPPGTHLITSSGVDAGDPKTVCFGPRFAAEPWHDVVGGCVPSGAEDALVVRHEFDGRTYATVFGQFLDARPGHLRVEHTRTPWTSTWVAREWTDPRPANIGQ